MTDKTDKIKLPVALCKRRKLTDKQREEIKEIYEDGGTSTRLLATEYKVSRRTIQFCIYPDRYEIVKAQRRQRWADGKYREHYNTNAHTKMVACLRSRKIDYKNNKNI